MKIALLPGSFDPPSLGHIDLINRASTLCDKLIVAVGSNSSKHALFSANEPVVLIQSCLSLSNVEVIVQKELTINLALENKIQFLIRGIRNSFEFEKEYILSIANHKLAQIETIFLIAHTDFLHISSTLIKEIALLGGPLDAFVPKTIASQIIERIREKI